MEQTTTKTTPCQRERLLVAGQQLFYARGVSVRVGALLKEANVARRSLYEHFGGKDGLVAAVLRRAADEDLGWYEVALADAAEPRARLLGLLDRRDELVSNADFRGCRYFATDLGIADPHKSGTCGDQGVPAAPPRTSRA
ncbi:TetR/AcrR family transcriptional regulator [Solicola gregarius]|uniref:TetR/AcrR family transcriptional regulator n=1 Tax=Solicola gregarius TaxID=2908642 RepID=A0AA46TK57_9ACTN|nr:TetR/AcrR family transcriptional regulator [Solicola gregarius]UYM06362.1 TetR/AcrR family transcriptional regulator [Solicola gregarius]